MAPARDSSHSGLELCSPRPAPGTSHRGRLRSLDGGPRGQDGRQQRLAENGSRGPSSASQRHPYMSREQFLATWARNGAFCTVADAGGKASLTVGLSLVRPVTIHGLEGSLPGKH